jgi:RNA polymerase sigma-54 factor
MIEQLLSQKQQQKLSPLQIQQIKLLELTGLEIENRIFRELEENPALEEAPDLHSDIENEDVSSDFDENNDSSQEDLSLGDYLNEDDIPDYKLQQTYYSEKSSREDIPYSEMESFHEYLLNQFHLKDLSKQEFQVGDYLIGNIDEDGYIRRKLSAISDDLAFQYRLEITVAKIEDVLKVIQELEPAGIGARDLRECLLLQLKRKELTEARKQAIEILTDNFDSFSRKQYEKIIKNQDIEEQDLKNVIKEITLLNPRPGSVWESNFDTKMAHITPDFVVDTNNGELSLNMQENIPELHVSREYNDMLNNFLQSKEKQSQADRDAINFVKQKIDSAKWFIDAIKQRNITLRKTMLAIINFQHDFFLSGEESDLKPMILKDVSELCGYDISTVSRVSNSKYVQTNFGVFSLKYFFSESMVNDEGEEISKREIKSILRKCIDEEDKSNPLTDDALMKELKSKGFDLARRTVAKYREHLNIPVSRLRKEI